MRVVHLSCVAPPIVGGIGRVASLEVDLLRERGIDAALHSPASVPSLVHVGHAAIPSCRVLDRVLRGADVVHVHYPYYGTAEIVALMRAVSRVSRLVFTLHMDATADGVFGALFRAHRRCVQPMVLRAADALLVSSADYAAHSSFAPWSSRMIALPFGVDAVRFSPASVDRSAFGLPANARVVSFVGGMDRPHAFKGVDVLLRAFAELPLQTWLLLGGEGELRVGYERFARELGVADRVKFLGSVSAENLPDVYRASDVCAFSSVSAAEAFGLVALEAQSCGIPVVASDLPGVRTVVEDRVTGLLTPPGDARELAAHLRLLLENPGLRQVFGAAARARVLSHFTWDRHVDGLVQVYQSVCASRS